MDKKQYITCSAIWFNDGIHYEHQPTNIHFGFVICGHRHHNCFMIASILNGGKKVLKASEVQGFMTNENIFVNRQEAAKIAFKSGQIEKELTVLYSEDLY